jgi:hypothetical protein
VMPDLLAGEEPELCTRLRAAGWQIWRLAEDMTEHDARITRFAEWWRRARRGGYGYAQVWSATRATGNAIYGRQITSALLWVVAVPLLVGLAALISQRPWLLLLLPALWTVQVLRIASRSHHGMGWPFRLRSGATTMAVKVAEVWGILQYWLGDDRGRTASYRARDSVLAGTDR